MGKRKRNSNIQRHRTAETERLPQKQNEVFRLQTLQGRFSVDRINVPSAQCISEYLSFYPDAAKKFFSWTEEEGKTRRDIQRSLAKHTIIANYVGLVLGFLIAVGSLGVTVYAIHKNQPWVAAAIGGATLVSLATAFIHGGQHFQQSAQKKISR